MQGSRWIAYVGAFRFPEGQAGSRRVYGMARSLVHAGHSVVVGSGESQPKCPQILYTQKQENLYHVGLGEMPERSASVYGRTVRWLMTLGSRTTNWLSQQPDKPACVICYGDSAPFAMRLLAWCRRHRVPIIFDVVEWYDSSHVMGGKFGPLNVSAKAALRVLYPKGNGIIAISSYLEAYYRERGCLTVRIPPTLDVAQIDAKLSPPTGPGDPLILAYSGVPGKKDLIGNVMDALLQLDPTGKYVRLNMAGPTVDQVLAMPHIRSRDFSAIPDCISALGPQPHARALDLVRNADFMPLLRLPLRYAQAGFPTKVPESLAVGTPVICNLTSDLGDYIHNGHQGLVCRDHTTSAFAEALEQALLLTHQQRTEMRHAARTQAEQAFDYRRFALPLSAFLAEVGAC